MAYAKCLIDYNNATLQGLPKPNLLEKFSEASEAFNNQVQIFLFSFHKEVQYFFSYQTKTFVFTEIV